MGEFRGHGGDGGEEKRWMSSGEGRKGRRRVTRDAFGDDDDVNDVDVDNDDVNDDANDDVNDVGGGDDVNENDATRERLDLIDSFAMIPPGFFFRRLSLKGAR